MATWTYQYTQGKDNRWSASGPTDHAAVQTVAGANAFAKSTKKTDFLPTVSSNGACQGISIWWTVKKALDQDFWAWLGPPKAAAPASPNQNGAAGEPVAKIKEVMLAQDSLNARRGTNHDAAVNYILAKTGSHLTRSRGLVERSNTDFKTLAYEVTVAKGYVFIGFSKSGWGGHAVAAHVCNDGSVEFMDPNIGELSFTDFDDYYRFMQDVLDRQVYKMKLDTFEIQTLQRPGK